MSSPVPVPSHLARPPLAAALWMCGAIVSFSAMAVAGRVVSVELDTFELMLYRSLIGVMLVSSVLAMRRDLGAWRSARPRLHIIRNISHFAGQNLWFFALASAPLAQVIALEFTTPIWAMLLAALFLAERPVRRHYTAAALGFSGALIITAPFGGGLSAGLVAAALCAIGFAGAAVATRALTTTDRVATILFWLTVTQSVFGLITAGIDGEIVWPSLGLWPWLAIIGAAGLGAHLSLTQALRLATPASVMPIDFMRLPVMAIIGWALYGEGLSLATIAGAVLILSGVWVLMARRRTTLR